MTYRTVSKGNVSPGKHLACDMSSSCHAPVTHIEDSGFVYCAPHAQVRKLTQRIRKLRPHELSRLKRGETVKGYAEGQRSILTHLITVKVPTKREAERLADAFRAASGRTARFDKIGSERLWEVRAFVQDIQFDAVLNAVRPVLGARKYGTQTFTSSDEWDYEYKVGHAGGRIGIGSNLGGRGKVYIVYVGGNEMGMIRAANHNAAEKKAQALYPGHQVSVAYTEI